MNKDTPQHEAISGPVHSGHVPVIAREQSELPAAEIGEWQAVLAVTREMFAGEPTIETMIDPEDADHPFVVLTVEWTGSGPMRELIERQLVWHDRIDRLFPGNAGAFRLSVVPV